MLFRCDDRSCLSFTAIYVALVVVNNQGTKSRRQGPQEHHFSLISTGYSNMQNLSFKKSTMGQLLMPQKQIMLVAGPLR